MTILKTVFLLCILYISALEISAQQTNDDLLISQLIGKDPLLDMVLNNPGKFEFQLIYSPVVEKNGKIEIKTYAYHLDQSYFYPASLIKLPLMATALEKLTGLRKAGVEIQTPFTLNTCSCDFSTNGYVSKSSNPCIEQFMREMMIMSNNDAFNLFVDLVGIDAFNSRMMTLGYNGICLKNRFVSGCGSKNKFYGGFSFLLPDSTIYTSSCDSSIITCNIDSSFPIKAGRYHTEKNKKVPGPKDYSESNFVRLSDAHELLIKLFYPESNEHPEFAIDPEYISLFKKSLGDFPRELKNSGYNLEKIPDHYYKFFLDPTIMDTKTGSIRLYNKVGLASGFISDVCYIEDKINNSRFFLSACILSKKDGWVGGGTNNYNDFGIPVLRKIGAILYQNHIKGLY